MQKKQLDLIRDAAVLLESEHLKTALGLMEIAHEYRPEGPYIKEKLEEYRLKYRAFQSLHNIHSSGELAIIPAGFRCYTKQLLSRDLGIKQQSLPFDSGFFSPYSISQVLKNRNINLAFTPSGHPSHDVCFKKEDVSFGAGVKGISFKRRDYSFINKVVINKDQPDINSYLDNTMGYYTIDNVNKFVLAHYNWHHYADEELSSGVHDPAINIPKINELLNKRIDRMFRICEQAKYIVFCYAPYKNYSLMRIDGEDYSLKDLGLLERVLKNTFKNKKVYLFEFEQINTPNKLLKKISF